MALQMTREEREAFLADVHVGVISIDQPDRAPLAVPIWYDYDPAVGIWVITSPDSRKGRRLEAAGRYSICAQVETGLYKYVSVEGPVVSTRSADLEKDLRPMARRYFGVEMGGTVGVPSTATFWMCASTTTSTGAIGGVVAIACARTADRPNSSSDSG